MGFYTKNQGYVGVAKDNRPLNLSLLGSTGALFSFTTFTFTNAAAVGLSGPTLGQAQTAYSGQSWLTGFFTITTQGFQEWTVPATGTYRIRAAGAQGGSGKYNIYYGGFGAILQGDVVLTAGDILTMAVGQIGGSNANGSAGGGGGTFVARNGRGNLLIAAGGGGGGGGNNSPVNGRPAVTAPNGNSNSSGDTGGVGGGGSVGFGGGAGGGGYFNAGGNGAESAQGGSYFNTGGTGNGGRGGGCAASQNNGGDTPGNYNNLGNDQGGFGGGGGGEWCSQGSVGGGGGYSGGAGNRTSSGCGGGGGSFFEANVSNRQTSDGFYNGSSSGITSIGSYNGITTLNAPRTQSMGYVVVTLL